MTEEPKTFEEFWPYYVSQHMNPTCRRLHFAGTALAFGCAAISPIVPPALLAAPAVGYGLSWIGHFVFEKNTPASWYSVKYFAWSIRGDLRMFRRMLHGEMGAELERAAELYAAAA
jgi:hypothetical protein